MNQILSKIEDETIYSDIKSIYKKINKTKILLEKQKEFVCEVDYLLLTRIEERYIPLIVNNYIILSKKEKKKQKEKVLSSLLKLKLKLKEIKSQTEERAIHELIKSENLLDLMIMKN